MHCITKTPHRLDKELYYCPVLLFSLRVFTVESLQEVELVEVKSTKW